MHAERYSKVLEFSTGNWSRLYMFDFCRLTLRQCVNCDNALTKIAITNATL